ncbi:hypothetical protein BDQ94DRAFT_154446 [Aspergillus welwitschiae]|uniref:Uncharacterized protein n=1 Tax=Aspergillus welwitschiae TaxID=1341132 RepID=A0A3F3PJP8_9EURO|nr:hypothetical protein BDQ94DRAFT_154446 [Aspergillus welwitschiae]RDH27161.1 hypothetical protein BDQ94DRAFT_154446 [Aspergillus welwitschiae]
METQPLAIRSSPSSGLFDTVAVGPARLVLIHHYVHPSAPPECLLPINRPSAVQLSILLRISDVRNRCIACIL